MTDIALVADLHGNWPATLAVEQDIRARGIGRIWCLGDVVGKGPSSDKTFDWARANCEFILQGNWDEGIAKKAFPRDQFFYDQLGQERMRALLELPLEKECRMSGRKIRLFHGRPIMPAPYGIQEREENLNMYFLPDYDVVGYADAHRQGLRVLRGLLFNTGSVGNAFGVPMAQYAVIRGEMDSREKAPFDVTLITVPYDRDQAVLDAREAGRRGLVNADLFEKEIQTGVYARHMVRPDP